TWTVTNYQLIMTLLLRGNSYRTIQAHCGAAHATIAKARKALDQHNLTTEAQIMGHSNEDLALMIGDGRATTAGEFVTIDIDTIIKARTGRKKTPLNVLWANYLNIPAPEGLRHYSYER